jgi:hypothetical protein
MPSRVPLVSIRGRIDMKQSPQLQKAQENMKPGAITLYGFLGGDTRNLVDILIEDDGIVKRLGATHEAIAGRMEELRDAGKRGLGEFISVPPHFQVRVESVRGKLPSPFGGPGLYAKTNTIVRNTRLERQVVYSDLHIHLIKDHGFYQGKGSRFRLEPKDVVEVLEVQPVEAD